MEVSGRVKMVTPTMAVSNSFKKREIVVTTEEQYPQHILIQFVQDKCDLLNGVQVGEQVKIGLNLRGREWINPQGEAKYFNEIQGWRIDRPQANQQPNQQQQNFNQQLNQQQPNQQQGFPPPPNFNNNNGQGF